MKEPGVNNVGLLFGPGCWIVYKCGNPSRYSIKTMWSSAAQWIPIPPGFWTIGSIGDSPLVTTAVAGIVSARVDPISATMRLHGVSFRAIGDRGVPPVPGWRRNAIFRPSIDQTGCVSRDVEGAMNRTG